MDLLLLSVFLSVAMLCITVSVATFDIIVVWFGVWLPMRKATAPEDRPFLWAGIAAYAKGERERHEMLKRLGK